MTFSKWMSNWVMRWPSPDGQNKVRESNGSESKPKTDTEIPTQVRDDKKPFGSLN